MMRALRSDRMTYAVQGFIEEKLGSKFVGGTSVEFAKSFEESGKLKMILTYAPLLNIIAKNFYNTTEIDILFIHL